PVDSSKSLDGRVAVITGAGQGVGQGVATALSRAGASVLIIGRRARKLEAAAEALRADGGRVATLAVAIAADGTAEEIVAAATAAAGRWDAAGYGVYSAIKEAQRAITRTAAHEWASEGIRALSVAPHAHSPGLDWWIENNPEAAEEFVAAIPAGRIGDPVEDI